MSLNPKLPLPVCSIQSLKLAHANPKASKKLDGQQYCEPCPGQGSQYWIYGSQGNRD